MWWENVSCLHTFKLVDFAVYMDQIRYNINMHEQYVLLVVCIASECECVFGAT